MIFMHPDTLAALRATLDHLHPGLAPVADLPVFRGERVEVCGMVPKHPTVWVFPVERFWIYEPSDEDWCRAAGIGFEGLDLDSLVFFRVHEADLLSDALPPNRLGGGLRHG